MRPTIYIALLVIKVSIQRVGWRFTIAPHPKASRAYVLNENPLKLRLRAVGPINYNIRSSSPNISERGLANSNLLNFTSFLMDDYMKCFPWIQSAAFGLVATLPRDIRGHVRLSVSLLLSAEREREKEFQYIFWSFLYGRKAHTLLYIAKKGHMSRILASSYLHASL